MTSSRLPLLIAALAVIPQADAAHWNFHRRHPVKPRVVTRTVAVPTPVPVVVQDPASAREAAAAQHEAALNVAAQQDRMNRTHSEGAEQRVVEHLRQRTEDGSADAPLDLARRHEQGLGVGRDPIEAERLYRLAASRGNTDAQRWLRQHGLDSKPVGSP